MAGMSAEEKARLKEQLDKAAKLAQRFNEIYDESAPKETGPAPESTGKAPIKRIGKAARDRAKKTRIRDTGGVGRNTHRLLEQVDN